MKRLVLVFGITLAFSTTAVAIDIAISTQANWWSQGAADREMQEIVDNVTGAPIEVFTATDQAALADWVMDHTGDGASDLLILCGQFPDTIYAAGNAQADDSLAELFLDDGNCIVNTGDYMFYVVNTAGTNAEGGLRTMMDIPSITMWDDDTAVVVTPDGQGYTPSLQDYATDRPFHLDELEGAWEPELILAQNAAGTRAEPVIVVNTETEGRLGIFYQTAGQDDDPRGEVISEWINNWYLPNLGGSNPLARKPNPRDGSMVDQTTVQASWNAGDFAALHDVYFGESFEEVSAATLDDADLYVGRQATTELPIGTPGGPSPDGLTPGKTYYWRVDEINDAEPDSPWKGNVWSFRVRPRIAWNPTPSDGVPYVTLEQDLSWEAGINTLFHTVYFGESFDEVSQAVAGGMMLTGLTLDPGPLAVDTTYYWRVDEFTFPDNATYKGDIWSFTTVPVIPVTNPDLVGWWTLDEGVGTTAVDQSGHGVHGTFLGDPQWADGYHGGALELDGMGDYVDFGNPQDWPSGQAARSMCGWATTESVAAGWRWIAAYGSAATSQAMFIGLNGASLYGGGYGDDVFLDGFWDLGAWHHICLTYDGTTARLYADGVEVASEAKTWDLALSRAHVGRQVNDAAEFWNGMVDDVRIYNKALTPDEISEIMRGNPLLAGNPEPAPGAVVDIRDATALRWSAGDTAASHDVYFGTDRDTLELQGNQPGTSFSLAGLVEFGGGDYFWRIDEVEADATTIHEGYTWRFTVPAYLVVDDFESYDDDENRLYEIWIDGVVNGTGSYVGYQAANNGTFGETVIVHSGGQSMPIQYDNTVAAGVSEADRTFTPAQNWTAQGVTTLVIHFRGAPGNTGQLYVKINGTKVPYPGDPADIASTKWIAWEIDLASVGVNLTSVSTLTIGIEGGGTGTVYVDDIWLTKP